MITTANNKAINLITFWEGFSPRATKCVDSEKYYTIGFGHYGADVKKGATITREAAIELLKKDLKTMEKRVNTYNKIYDFNENEYNALISFCYNVGNIKGVTRDGTRSKKEIAEAMPLYCKAGGKTLLGLVRRRASEVALYNTPVIVNTAPAKKTNEQIALEVIRGKWGNGANRKKKLTAAGYDYNAIQKLVNAYFKK